MPDGPMTVVFDPMEVAPLLRAAARAIALDLNSSLVWKDDKDWPYMAALGDKLLFGLFNAAHPLRGLDALFTREYVRGNEELDVNYAKVKTDTEDNFKLFSSNFAKAAAQGPAQGVKYLQEKKQQIDQCYANMSYKCEGARKVQSEVQRVLTNAVDNTYRVKVAADLGMAVGLAFAPVWVAVPGGIIYTLATETAKTRLEVDRADVAVIRKTLTKPDVQANLVAGAGTAAAQGYAEKCAKDAELVVEEAEKVATKVEVKCSEKLGQIAKNAGGTLNREARKQLARQTERIAAEKEAVALAKTAAGEAGAVVKGFKVGGIVVALFFMKDDLYKFWYGYSATEREELLKKTAKGRD